MDKVFEALLYGITAGVVDRLICNNGWDEDYALEKFCKSRLYSYLENENTKVWHYSSCMLAQLFGDEQKGELVFPEGV